MDHAEGMSDRFIHPWLKESRRLAPGAHMLLFGLITTTSTSYHSPFSDPSDPPQLSPLLSQPLVEAALRIPSYMHFQSAQDRSVARSAFADALPPLILQRGFGKGGPNLWAKDVIDNNYDFLRAYLLDGVLSQKRLIDRKRTEVALSPTLARTTAMVGDIFAKLYIEAWLRKWRSPCESSPSAHETPSALSI
jgi:asparagine synthase (glutamine-hydrolysing)